MAPNSVRAQPFDFAQESLVEARFAKPPFDKLSANGVGATPLGFAQANGPTHEDGDSVSFGLKFALKAPNATYGVGY